MYGLDVLHKFNWIRLIARMFEAMAGNFAHSSDIQLFVNVINGALALHSEDACILRYAMAAIINAASQFRNIFASSGYFLVMPSLLRIYSNNQTNELITRTVELVCKQLYILHRKPFLLQMFGSIAPILDKDDDADAFGDAFKVQPKYLYKLLRSLSRNNPDLLHIMELVKLKKPLSALDFCYQGDPENISVLECISLCVLVVAYDSGTRRAREMLAVLQVGARKCSRVTLSQKIIYASSFPGHLPLLLEGPPAGQEGGRQDRSGDHPSAHAHHEGPPLQLRRTDKVR